MNNEEQKPLKQKTAKQQRRSEKPKVERSIKLIKPNLNGPLAERKRENEGRREGERERAHTNYQYQK